MSQARRPGIPRARAGKLKAKWGSIEGDPHRPDLVYVWGEGIPRADAALLHDTLASPRFRPLSQEWDMSFMEELKDRGYDIGTLEISISRKPEHTQGADLGGFMSTVEALGAATKEIAGLKHELEQEKESYQFAYSHAVQADAEIARLKAALEATRPSRDAMLEDLERKLDMEAQARQKAEEELSEARDELAQLRGDTPSF